MTDIDQALSWESPAFARAVRAIIAGDAAALSRMLAADPALLRARSRSAHHASLLHYIAANGVEPALQRVPVNAPDMLGILLRAGAVVDAPCDAYQGRWPTTLELLVSSDHPAKAGVAAELTDLLCEAGAALDGPRGDGAPLASALMFAHFECAAVLHARGAHTEHPVLAAAAGELDWVRGWLDGDPARVVRPCPILPEAPDRTVLAEQALVFASLCGEIDVVRLLLERGVNLDADPPGSHWTATALHSAAGQGQRPVVELLLAKGADQTLRDRRHGGTARGWAEHLGHSEVAKLFT